MRWCFFACVTENIETWSEVCFFDFECLLPGSIFIFYVFVDDYNIFLSKFIFVIYFILVVY